MKRARQCESDPTWIYIRTKIIKHFTTMRSFYLLFLKTQYLYICILNPVRMLKMAAGFLLQMFTSCVLLRPITSHLTATAAGQLLLSHTAAKTQGSPQTPPNTPTFCELHATTKPKNLPVSALICLPSVNRPIAVSQQIRYITEIKQD